MGHEAGVEAWAKGRRAGELAAIDCQVHLAMALGFLRTLPTGSTSAEDGEAWRGRLTRFLQQFEGDMKEIKTHPHEGTPGGWCITCGMHYLHESHTFEEIKYENTCGVNGCIASHKPRFNEINYCKCRGDYICWVHRNALQVEHRFPRCENPPAYCRAPRDLPCSSPHCDCGMQGR